MGKGENTRGRIVETALQRASTDGLNALSIGELAAALGMSKSGLFAHFGSKEALQEAVVQEMLDRFRAVVWEPAAASPAGAERLRAVFANWLRWVEGQHLPGGCPINAAVVELDDQPGPLRDRLVQSQRRWVDILAAEFAALSGGGDPSLWAFELYGIVSSYSTSRRLLGDPKALEHAQTAFGALMRRAGA